MGRYAFFNTEFEYKFSFGIQPSDDIELFGGYITRDYNIDDNCMEHTWTSEDKSFIVCQINSYNINFEIYEKNLKGTQQLYHYLCDTISNSTIRLGCVIYHQLLYTPVLTCRYEVF